MAGSARPTGRVLVVLVVCILASFIPQRADCCAAMEEDKERPVGNSSLQGEKANLQWLEVRNIALDVEGRRYEARIVFTRELFEDIHLYVYDWSRTPKLLMHANKLAFGRFLDAMTVPHPDNPENKLLLVYSVGQYPRGTLWYVDPRRKRVRKLLEGNYLDATYLFTRKVVTEWLPAHYVLAEGEYDFQLMAKRDWKWDTRRQRFVPGKWRVAEPQYGYFDMIDRIMAQSEAVGSACDPPEPAPAEMEAKVWYLENWLKGVRLDSTSRTYNIQIASDGREAYLSVYAASGKQPRLVRCTPLSNFGYVVSLRAVPYPGNPHRSLIVVCKGDESCVIWRIDPETMRPVQLMEETAGVDVSRISQGIVLEWKQALLVLVLEGWDAYPPAFRNPKAMAYRVWRWDKREQRFVVASSWRIGKWSRADYRRFGFWE